MQLQIQTHSHVEEVVRRALRKGTVIDDMFVIVDSTPDGVEVSVGACDRSAILRAWHTFHPKFVEAAQYLLDMERIPGWINVLYFSPEEWIAARLYVPDARLCSATKGQT
jgi:hypothetical protein